MTNKVFISYKNTKNGAQTLDSQMAQELYDALMDSGINTFFAGKTLFEAGTDRYKEHIDKELDNCCILIVVGTSVDNMSSRWVKYEWDGFVLDILNGCNKKVFTYVEGVSPHDLPRALRGAQSFTRNKVALSTIVEFIKNAIDSIEEQNTRIVDVNKTTDNTSTNSFNSFDEAFKLSSNFLHSGATQLKTCSLTDIEENLSRISSLFHNIHSVKNKEEMIESDDIAQTLYGIICEASGSSNNKLIKIKGPLGSYKNRLLQYLYLLVAKKHSEILPFYIDVAMYERFIDNNDTDNRDKLESLVINHFQCIKHCIANASSSTPIVIIDGIRDFSSGRDSIYSIIKSELTAINCKLIVSMDTDFTFNPKNKFALHPLAGTDFEYFIRINSMSTYNKEESIQFIRNCIKTFQIQIPFDGVDEYAIYDRLIKLGVISLDAYWLKNLLTEMLGNILNNEISISDLYEAICLREIGLNSLPDAARLAFEYEYGEMDFSDSDFYSDKKWRLIRKHRTVLEFLIARYYIYKFEELDYNNTDTIEDKLHFFCMVLPKSVSIFIAPMFKRYDNYENKVFNIAKRYYDSMNTFERTEMVYWLGRINNSVRKEECRAFLKDIWKKQRNEYFEGYEGNTKKLKNAAFLYRTISVSLIVQDDKEVAKEYFRSLLCDKLSNEINRGFHLTYYGDKHYIPNKTLLDYEDNICYGVKTLDSLCVSIDAKKNDRRFNCLLVLELFTVCSLLQARIELSQKKKWIIPTFKPYALKTIDNLKWIINQRRLSEFDNMKCYFIWILKELEKYYIDNEVYSYAETTSILEAAHEVKRTGWINRNVADPENIVEHMYSCWLIGVLFLPEHTDDTDYNKNTILNMLLIHDLGETVTGDIPRPEKKQNPQKYNDIENNAIHALFLSGTYPHSTELSNYLEYWNSWYKSDCKNALVAKDIDIIQALYQLCIYYINSQIDITSEDFQEWFDELYDVTTPEGHRIVDTLILNNQKFHELVSKYGRTLEDYYG